MRNVVCQACTLPSVCLPHRCQLPPHDLVAMCYLTGVFPCNDGVFSGSLPHYWCSMGHPGLNPGSSIRAMVRPLVVGSGGSVRGRLRCAIMVSRSFVSICEFHALDTLLVPATFLEPFDQHDSEHLLTRSLVPVPDVSRAPETLSVVDPCVEPLISRIGLALSVFPSPSLRVLVWPSPEDRCFFSHRLAR